jgi:hypothetical protein
MCQGLLSFLCVRVWFQTFAFDQPLLECKANERRSKAAMENIGQFYKEITLMFSADDARLRVEVGKCLRTIVHAGKDPSTLRADQIEWISDGKFTIAGGW